MKKEATDRHSQKTIKETTEVDQENKNKKQKIQTSQDLICTIRNSQEVPVKGYERRISDSDKHAAATCCTIASSI